MIKQEGYICEYQGHKVEDLSVAKLIEALTRLGLDKSYDLETLTREELINLCWSYSYDTSCFRHL